MAGASTRPRRCGSIHLPLEELGALADRRRQLARAAAYDGRGNEIVTYIVDRNINYTNVCNVYCKFCAFYRTEKDADAYVISLAELDQKIEETIALGGTQILHAGRPSPQAHQAVVSGPAGAHKGQVPADQHPRLQPERVRPLPRGVQRAAGEDHRRFQSRRPGVHPGRRRRDSGGPRAAASFAAQGDERRLAGSHGRRAPARVEFLRHHDVRPRRDRGGPDRASGTRARPAGQDRRGSPPSSAGPSRRSIRGCARRRSGRTSICAPRRWRASTWTTSRACRARG